MAQWLLKHVVGTPLEIEEFARKQKLVPKTIQSVQIINTNNPAVVVLWFWVLE